MAGVVVHTTIDQSTQAVWADLEDVSSHVEWMHDAVSIRFVTEQTQGKGTTFECDTRVGPISMTDIMEITAWEPEVRMGVRHVGLVTGAGAFTLHALNDAQTEFRWEEELHFPWWLGGPVGEFVATPILRAIWRGNLRRLKARIESV